MWVEVGQLSQVWVYALKSAAGAQVEAAEVERRGLRGDRRWMLVDSAGRMISQRTLPAMARLTAQPCGADGAGLHVVSRRGGGDWGGALTVEPLPLHPSPASERVEVAVWDDLILAQPAPDVASAWLAGELAAPCALVYLPHDTTRPVDPRYAEPGDEVSFADGFPLLVLSQGSLDDLADRAADPSLGDPRRLRPNLVISGCDPYAEDTWARVRVGGPEGVELALPKPCSRCGLINVHPDTAAVGPEPLATLSRYRKDPSGRVLLGQNAIPRRLGTVRVGQTVEAWR